MASYGEAGDPPAGPQPSEEASLPIHGEWERQFIDDLVAANRMKTFLVTQGIDVPKDVLTGLAGLSERFRAEIEEFTTSERKRHRARPFRPRMAPERVT